MSFLLSVVVPTKNRYNYLKHLIELIKGFESNDIELIIQDNSDDEVKNESFINREWPTWLKYYYCCENLTSIQNFDLAIKHASGRYVCFIGDDDGITRYIIDCARWMERNDIEAARSAKTYYNWPEVTSHGFVSYETSRRVIEFLNPLEELKNILNEGCQFLENIPVTYVGIVKREILEKIYSDYGTYFPGGASADIANGVALCFYVKRYAKINVPFIITGTSKKTGGVTNRKKPLSFSEIPFIASSVASNWEGIFPSYWLGPLVWPESAIKSLRTLGKESFILYLNHNKVMARIISRTALSKGDYEPYIKSKFFVYIYIIQSKIRYYYFGILSKAIQLFSRGTRGWHQCRSIGLPTIVEAERRIISMYSSLSKDIIE